ncbi:hypothetical protein [Flavobacterium frigoris]|uniref:Uncharacterized protein n=1 Tax=Flavobacterium frigoris TaxID=229204 RepID=A0A1H9LI02_FLAFI|nr:hypothetical protein [Flavobacterium frigoris]SER11142.1 hypothetical protein SAMN05444355_10742 [Flavobacterium frigoris]
MGTPKKRQPRTFNTFSDSDSAVNNYQNNKKREVEASKPVSSQSISAEMELTMKRKRSNILTIATRTGIKEADSWTKFNSWMLASSVHHKALNAYDYNELDELDKQFRQLEINYEHSAQKVGNKAWHHATGIPQSSQN